MSRRSSASLLLSVAALALSFLSATAADATRNREDQLLDILRSPASAREKDAACAELKFVGTAKAIPVLATLLPDPQLSHSARFVLESMREPEAGQALLKALALASPEQRVGIIESLGERREAAAVPELRGYLTDKDEPLANATAFALGKVGSKEALEALTATLNARGTESATAVFDAALSAAERLRVTGDLGAAQAGYQAILSSASHSYLLAAAHRGLMLCAGPETPTLVAKALMGPGGPTQSAALAVAKELPGPNIAPALVGALERVPPRQQVAVLALLGQKGDNQVAPAVIRVAQAGGGVVRISAINALALIGGGGAVEALAQFAAEGERDESAAAREALVRLVGPDVSAAMLSLLEKGSPAQQVEIARALGARGDVSAIQQVLRLAGSAPASSRPAVYEAAGALARAHDLPALVKLVEDAPDSADRANAAEALNSACQRLMAAGGKLDLTSLIAACQEGRSEVRVALLPVCSGIAGDQTREVLLSGVGDRDAAVREAAIRALADSQDPAVLGKLTELGCALPEANLRAVAIGGCVRLAAGEESRSLGNGARIEALTKLMDCQPTVEQQKRIISGLARIPDIKSLDRVEALLGAPATANEAARAIVQLAPLLPETDRAVGALEKVLAGKPDAETQKAAEALMNQVLARADYLKDWQVAGPYEQAGKNYAGLFDTSFPPEQADAAVVWQARSARDPQKPEVVDFLKEFGGEQRVAYARTWVHTATEQPAMMELGSDDGAKVWLNQQLVHSNNIARPLQPGSDKVPVVLRAGWNSLLVKVTQNNLGWEFCIRFLKRDGSRLSGLQTSAGAPPR